MDFMLHFSNHLNFSTISFLWLLYDFKWCLFFFWLLYEIPICLNMHEHEKDLLLMRKIVYFANCPVKKWLL